MGGVHFIPIGNKILPILWRERFPANVSKALVWHDNPRGTVNNSKLELAGLIAHADVLSQHVDIAEYTTHNCYDNTATVQWQRKGSTTTLGPTAYLLRLQAIHKRHHRYIALHDYVPVKRNVLADICSRRCNLSDNQLLTLFNSEYPQTEPWTMCHFRPQMLSALTCPLFRKQCDLESLLNGPQHWINIGNNGTNSVSATTLTHFFATGKTQHQSSRCLANDTVMVDWHPKNTLCDLEQ